MTHAAQPPSQGPLHAQSQAQSQAPLPFDREPQPRPTAAQLLLGRAMPAEPGVWDELRDETGALRPAWAEFARALPDGGAVSDLAADLTRRLQQVAQRIQLDGVTHNVFSDATPGGVASRPWSLELLPHIIEAGDRWPSVLQRRFGRLVQEVRHDLVARLRSLRDNIEETLGSVDPEDLMDELEAQVHYETNRVVVEHQRTLRDQLDSLSEELSGLFHLPADAGRIAFDGPVLRTPDAPSLQRAMFEPSDESAREAWATAGRFGVSGLSASIVLATKFSMGLALAVPVGGLGIAVAAIPMATLAYRRSRKADIAKRRHELTSTIARHLDDVQFRLIHDLDGSLPTVLEEIQSYCSTIADDLRLTAARDLEAARSGAENAGVETNARLADASAALDGLLAVDRQLVEALERTGG